MNSIIPNSISRVRFNTNTMPHVYPNQPRLHPTMTGGGFDFSVFAGMINTQVTKITIGFLILGGLGLILHRLYRSKLFRDSNKNFLTPTWIMGIPISQISEFTDRTPIMPRKNALPTHDNDEPIKQKVPNTSKRANAGYVNFQDHKNNRPMSSTTSSPREINREYKKCIGYNPDREEVCDFWKNLDGLSSHSSGKRTQQKLNNTFDYNAKLSPNWGTQV